VIILFNGEGPTDIGCKKYGGDEFSLEPGPMAIVIDKIVNNILGFSPLKREGCCKYIDTKSLRNETPRPKSLRSIPGKKSKNIYFVANARSFASIAKKIEAKASCPVIAIFFRDHDKTRSTKKNVWKDKFDSILLGFEIENFSRGIPMLPNPKSEAWLLCCINTDTYDCSNLEIKTGSKHSLTPIKTKLKQQIGDANVEHLNSLIEQCFSNSANINKLKTMPSFLNFYDRLERTLRDVKSILN